MCLQFSAPPNSYNFIKETLTMYNTLVIHARNLLLRKEILKDMLKVDIGQMVHGRISVKNAVPVFALFKTF